MSVPYVVLSCAMSVDGYIDDTSSSGLILSNGDDLDQVDELRSQCDAILVGANTLRKDNPRLLVRSDARRAARRVSGRSEDIIKATITRTGNLNRDMKFFTTGLAMKLVYCPHDQTATLQSKLEGVANVVGAGDKSVRPAQVLEDLRERGVRRLLIEGGMDTGTMFMQAGLVDELRLAVAPFFVGDSSARRFVSSGCFPHNKDNRMVLRSIEALGDVAVLVYDLPKLPQVGG